MEIGVVGKGFAGGSAGTNRMDKHGECGIYIISGILRVQNTSNWIVPNIVFSPDELGAERSDGWGKYIGPVIKSSVSCQTEMRTYCGRIRSRN